MVKFVNKATHGIMWVAEERKQEYLEAGHKLASEPVEEKPTEESKPKRNGKRGK